MLSRLVYIMLSITLIAIASGLVYGQSVLDKHPGNNQQTEEEQPKGLQETLVKMRIEKEKKEHEEMVARGQELIQIADQLEKRYVASGTFTDVDLSRLATVEKMARKIRSDLGGNDDDDDKPVQDDKDDVISTVSDAVKTFQSSAERLFDELKKTTRFSISAAAIQSSSAVIRLARFLRIKK